MARRKKAESPAGAVLFDRSPEEWRQLGAPDFVSDVPAACEAYVVWAPRAYGGESDPTDEVVRRYYVEMAWLKRCVRPQFLYFINALNAAERELMESGGQSARWGRPGRCWAPRLLSDAGVPEWLRCCRSSGGR